jgi:hypothetical protein
VVDLAVVVVETEDQVAQERQDKDLQVEQDHLLLVHQVMEQVVAVVQVLLVLQAILVVQVV